MKSAKKKSERIKKEGIDLRLSPERNRLPQDRLIGHKTPVVFIQPDTIRPCKATLGAQNRALTNQYRKIPFSPLSLWERSGREDVTPYRSLALLPFQGERGLFRATESKKIYRMSYKQRS